MAIASASGREEASDGSRTRTPETGTSPTPTFVAGSDENGDVEPILAVPTEVGVTALAATERADTPVASRASPLAGMPNAPVMAKKVRDCRPCRPSEGSAVSGFEMRAGALATNGIVAAWSGPFGARAARTAVAPVAPASFTPAPGSGSVESPWGRTPDGRVKLGPASNETDGLTAPFTGSEAREPKAAGVARLAGGGICTRGAPRTAGPACPRPLPAMLVAEVRTSLVAPAWARQIEEARGCGVAASFCGGRLTSESCEGDAGNSGCAGSNGLCGGAARSVAINRASIGPSETRVPTGSLAAESGTVVEASEPT